MSQVRGGKMLPASAPSVQTLKALRYENIKQHILVLIRDIEAIEGEIY